MSRKVGIAVVVLVALIVAALVYIGTRPDSFRIERSAQLAAPAEAVFPLIDDLRQWTRWSPFEKLDPEMKKCFDGPDSGPGASYAWAGNDSAGEGRVTIVESKPDELVALRLEFVKPFVCTNQVRFTLAPSASGTKVTWRMEGENKFMGKVFSIFMDMDKMVGKEFEEGLANLGAAAQAPASGPEAPASGPEAPDEKKVD